MGSIFVFKYQNDYICFVKRKAGNKQNGKTNGLAKQVIEELAHIAFANFTDFVEVQAVESMDDKKGVPQLLLVKSTAELDKKLFPAIAELKQTDKGITIKLHDKLAALDKLSKLLGLGAEVAPNKKQADFSKLSNEELMALQAISKKIYR